MAKNRHEELGLTDEDVLNIFETMLRARRVDERMWLLNRAGKIPFVISCQGQEAAQAGAAYALDKDKDWIAPYYRDMAVVLTFWNDNKRTNAIRIRKSRRSKLRWPSNARSLWSKKESYFNRFFSGNNTITTCSRCSTCSENEKGRFYHICNT